MTIVEALKQSKETGQSFWRTGGENIGYGGWIRYDPDHLFRDLSADDLMADDWWPTTNPEKEQC